MGSIGKILLMKIINMIVVIIFCFLFVSLAEARNVLVESGKTEGKGYAWLSGDECYVVTPLHVLEGLTTVTIKSQSSDSGKGTHIKNLIPGNPEIDLALLKTDNIQICLNENLDPAKDLNSYLYGITEATLSYVDKSYALSNIPVRINSFGESNEIFVTPIDGDTIWQGMSGAILRKDSKILGMLHSQQSGTGRIYRQDYIYKLFSDAVRDSEADKAYNEILKKINKYKDSGMLDRKSVV